MGLEKLPLEMRRASRKPWKPNADRKFPVRLDEMLSGCVSVVTLTRRSEMGVNEPKALGRVTKMLVGSRSNPLILGNCALYDSYRMIQI